jgi:hypothetical protein
LRRLRVSLLMMAFGDQSMLPRIRHLFSKIVSGGYKD